MNHKKHDREGQMSIVINVDAPCEYLNINFNYKQTTATATAKIDMFFVRQSKNVLRK